MEDKLIKISDEILIKMAKGEISPQNKVVKIAVFIKETLSAEDDQKKSDPSLKAINETGQEKFPEMLKISYRVFNLMKEANKSFSSACITVAKNKGVRDSTIRQACCKNLDLTAEHWNQYFLKKENALNIIKEHFLSKYPNFEKFIKEYIY